MIYITGDTHREFARIEMHCRKNKTTKDDVMIILGDACINYFDKERDLYLKKYLAKLPITLFCIHGNHEMRPHHRKEYTTEKLFHKGFAYTDPRFPNQVFAMDGQVYDFAGRQCLVIGGAYSIDKERRVEGIDWWADEQPDETTKEYVEHVLSFCSWQPDIILSHTCPLKYIPTECFLPDYDQSKIDNSTERWLDDIEDRCTYNKWYCGHFHTDKTIDRLRFVGRDIIELK